MGTQQFPLFNFMKIIFIIDKYPLWIFAFFFKCKYPYKNYNKARYILRLTGKEKMEEIKVIISLTLTVFSLIISTVFTFVKLIKIKRKCRDLENDDDIYSLLLELMKIAESFVNYNGEEKKEYVLTRLNQFANLNNFKYDEEISIKKLEELISLSKNVNNKEKNNGQE